MGSCMSSTRWRRRVEAVGGLTGVAIACRSGCKNHASGSVTLMSLIAKMPSDAVGRGAARRARGSALLFDAARAFFERFRFFSLGGTGLPVLESAKNKHRKVTRGKSPTQSALK